MRVAASILILFSVGYLGYRYLDTPETPLVAEATGGTEVTKPSETKVEIPVKQTEIQPAKTQEIKPVVKPKVENGNTPAQPAPVKKAEQPSPKKDSELNQFHFFSVDRLETAGVEVAYSTVVPEKLKKPVAEPQLAPVKITYIASNPDRREFDLPTLEKLSKVISKAQELTPGELLADIRDAKHHLLNRN